VRTKWQSGSAVGNAAPGRRTGNRPIGNEGCAPGKSSPYLSRKIYPDCCRRLVFTWQRNVRRPARWAGRRFLCWFARLYL